MKDRRIWIFPAGLLLVGAAFLLLSFRAAVSDTQVVQSIMVTELEGRQPERLQPGATLSVVLVGKGSLVRALRQALPAQMDSRLGMAHMQWEQQLKAKYPNPVLVVDAGQARPLWTPFFGTSRFSISAAYATDGDTTFLQHLDRTQPYIRSVDPAAVQLYTEYELGDRSLGLLSRPGYDRYLAEYLTREIVQALKNLYNIQDAGGGY